MATSLAVILGGAALSLGCESAGAEEETASGTDNIIKSAATTPSSGLRCDVLEVAGEPGAAPPGNAVDGALPDDEPCPLGEYCRFEKTSACGAKASGRCTRIETICSRELNPVCGCDGVTYDNECAAAAAGRSVVGEGPCAAKPVCTPNADTFCRCEDGSEGTKLCNMTGTSFGACVCQ